MIQAMRHAIILSLLVSFGSGCTPTEGTSPTGKAKNGPTQEHATSQPPEEPKAEAPSLVSQAAQTVTAELRSPKSIRSALGMAVQLDAWIVAHPSAPQASDAKALGASLRLQAVAAAFGLGTPPALKALGGGGAEVKLMKRALVLTKDTPGAQSLALSAQAMLASIPDSHTDYFDRKEALELALGDSLAGQSLRLYWLTRLQRALEALHHPDLTQALPGLARAAGRLLCPACGDARHATPEIVTASLLMPKNKGGFICDLAYGAKERGSTPEALIAQISLCLKDLAIGPVAEPAMYWGSNLLASATLVMANDLAGAAVPTGPLSVALKKRVASIRQLLSQPLILPTPSITQRLRDHGNDANRAHPAAIEGIGFGGQLSTRPSVAVYEIGPSAFKAFLRPVVGLKDGAVQSLSLQAESPAASVSLSEIEGGTPSPETGGLSAIVGAAERTLQAAKSLSALPTPADADTADMIVDALAPGWALTRTLDSLKSVGYAHFRFIRTSLHGQALPLLVRETDPELVARLKIGYERPMIAHVRAKSVDLWFPSKPTPGLAKPSSKAKVPGNLLPGYRGKDLVRLRVPIPEGMGRGIDGSTLVIIGAALDYIRRTSHAGPLLHVVSGKNARAGDVLRVAHVFQTGKGASITGTEAIWPGSTCQQTDVSNSSQGVCPTGVSVAFSKLAAPSDRGVSSEPSVRTKKPEKKEAKPVKAAAGFCDKRAISSKMKRRKAAFRFCYEKALRMKKGLEGRVKLRFTIGASGAVVGSPTVVSATLKDRAVHACLARNISRVKFSPPDGGLCTVSWPFKFKSN